jgi:hypothetical protein
VDVVGRVAPRPLLVIHGMDDRRITQTQVGRLFAAAQEPKLLWLVEGATHDGIRSSALDSLALDVVSFFDTSLSGQEDLPSGIAIVPGSRDIPIGAVQGGAHSGGASTASQATLVNVSLPAIPVGLSLDPVGMGGDVAVK